MEIELVIIPWEIMSEKSKTAIKTAIPWAIRTVREVGYTMQLENGKPWVSSTGLTPSDRERLFNEYTAHKEVTATLESVGD